jgi:hypothetical protein
MSKYSLSEEYSKIYSNKFDTVSYNNLRFLDLMLDEDIEQVMESLYWEFRDYGNSSDEAFSILESSLEDEVLSESLEYICDDYYASAYLGDKKAKEYIGARAKQYRAKAKWDSRKARVTGAVRKVKGDIKATVARVANLAKSAQSNISSARKSGMAQLTKLVRGASTVGNIVASNTKKLASSAKEGGRRVASNTKKLASSAKEGGRRVASNTKKLASSAKEGGRRVAAATGAGLQAFKKELSRKPTPQMKAPSAAGQINGASQENRVATTSARSNQRASISSTIPRKKSKIPKSVTRENIPFLLSQKAKLARQRKSNLSDDFKYLLSIIAEDLVNEGYADTFEDALIIFENLSDSIVESTLQEYADYYLTE